MGEGCCLIVDPIHTAKPCACLWRRDRLRLAVTCCASSAVTCCVQLLIYITKTFIIVFTSSRGGVKFETNRYITTCVCTFSWHWREHAASLHCTTCVCAPLHCTSLIRTWYAAEEALYKHVYII